MEQLYPSQVAEWASQQTQRPILLDVREGWELQTASVRAEGFEFGRGWSIVRSSARMTAPRPLDLRVIPVAWTPGTWQNIRFRIKCSPGNDGEILVSVDGDEFREALAFQRAGVGDEVHALDDWKPKRDG